MELKRDDIIKALECCGADDGCVGDKCPYYANCQFCITRISKDALALIKELTEENERLRNKVIATIILTDKDAEKIKNECLERIELDVKAIQADTVREMRNLIAQKIGTYTKESYVYVHAWFKLIDQIAEEMLEGNNDND